MARDLCEFSYGRTGEIVSKGGLSAREFETENVAQADCPRHSAASAFPGGGSDHCLSFCADGRVTGLSRRTPERTLAPLGGFVTFLRTPANMSAVPIEDEQSKRRVAEPGDARLGGLPLLGIG